MSDIGVNHVVGYIEHNTKRVSMLACVQYKGYPCEDMFVEQHMKCQGEWKWDIGRRWEDFDI